MTRRATADDGDSQPIVLSPEQIAARKRQTHRHYTVVQVPGLRALGFLLLSGIVLAHAWATSAVALGTVARLVAGFAAYAGGSWLVLRTWHGRSPVDLGVVFLVIDPFVWMGAVYVTGAEASWLWVLPLVRVADQLNTSRREALGFTAVGVVAYLSLLLTVRIVDGRMLDWSTQVGRLLFLAGCGTYLASTAATAERLRSRLAEAVRSARQSILQLRDQSALLQDALERADAASRAKSEFLANVSHELRTPLNAIVGYTELLQDEWTDAPAPARRDLDAVGRSAQQLHRLISDVIELSRLEADRVTLDVQPFPVAALLADVMTLVQPAVDRHGNRLVAHGAGHAGTMTTDEAKVRHVLVQLLDNAAKFTERGTIALTCADAESAHVRAVRFTIADTGVGMTAEQLARIRRFDPFVQGDPSATRRFGGTGLGLAIAQRFCARIGGTLTIDSAPGAGTTVAVLIPVRLPERASRQVPVARATPV